MGCSLYDFNLTLSLESNRLRGLRDKKVFESDAAAFQEELRSIRCMIYRNLGGRRGIYLFDWAEKGIQREGKGRKKSAVASADKYSKRKMTTTTA